MRAWVNGEVLADPEAPVLTVFDHGLTVGDGVFETIKVVDGRAFALTRHLRRLRRSADGLGLQIPDARTLETAVEAVLRGQDLPLGRVRITVTGGVAPLGSDRGDAPPTVAVVGGPMAPRPTSTAIATVPWARNDRGALSGLKTTSYAENVVALARAGEQGASEAIFANTSGALCEGTGSNIFYVAEGELRTPALSTGCLAGITRELVLEWYGGVECAEPLEVLQRADEIFLVSTTRDVQPVHRCDETNLDAPGPVTREVLAAWDKHAAADIDP
ncbi:MAG: aminotransferase class IV [Actinomycetota bacterium]|nr:aminotransferase class IV [Actinomycetota bacterium]